MELKLKKKFVLRSKFVKGRLGSDELMAWFERCIVYATDTLRQKKKVKPTLLLAAMNPTSLGDTIEYTIDATQLGSPAWVKPFVKKISESHAVYAYVFLTEVWHTTQKPGEQRKYMNLEDDPRRKEALTVMMETQAGRLFTRLNIERYANGNPYVTTREDLPGETNRGNLSNVLFEPNED